MAPIATSSLPADDIIEWARASMPNPARFVQSSPVAERNEALANSYLLWLRDTANRQRGTVYNYASVLIHYLAECVGSRALDGVAEADIEHWLQRPRQGRARGRVGSPATRARDIAVLRSFYKWLHARDLIRSNVTLRLVSPNVHNRNPRAIPDAIWREAWSQADGQIMLVLGIGFFLGLRRAEIAALTPAHVDGHRGLLVNFVRKGGGEDTMPALSLLDAIADLGKPLVEPKGGRDLWNELTLTAQRAKSSSPLLGYSHPDNINKALGKYLASIGMAGAFTPHALRHSFVTNLLRLDMPIEMVSELANHSSIDITMRYVRGGRDRLTEWHQTAGRLSVRDWR